MRPTGFEPVTFGFVDRAGDPAGLRGARFQASFVRSDSAEIGWTPCGTVPHFVPHVPRRQLPKLMPTSLRFGSYADREVLVKLE
jgi:hypothetical protein